MVDAGVLRTVTAHVDVWCIALHHDESLVQRADAVLSADERTRAAAFLFPRLRHDFTASRAALRILLSKRTGTPAADIRFDYGPQGKPALTGDAGSVRFNASHSDGTLACAFTAGCDIGVDVERQRPIDDYESLARRFFSPAECGDLMSLPERDRVAAFFDCWTRKEAFVKARGGGLSIPLDSFRVSLSPDAAQLLECSADAGDPREWTLLHFRPAEGFSGAVAINARAATINVRHIALTGLV